MAAVQDWGARALAELDAFPDAPDPMALSNAKPISQAEQQKLADSHAAWAKQALAELDALPEPSAGQQALAAGQGLVAGLAGAAKSMFSDLPHAIALGAAGTVADVLGRSRPDESSFNRLDIAGDIGRGAEALQQAVTPENPLLAGGAAFHYGETAGAIAPSLAAAFMGPLGAVVGAAQTAGQTGADAQAGGAGGLALLGATGAGYLAGGALSGGVASALENIGTRSGGALLRTLQAAARGAGTGMAYTALTNAIHNWATDDEISILQNAGEGAGVGAALGGLSSIVAGATQAARAKREVTRRQMTGQGWTGELLPEDAPLTGDPEHPLAVAQARTDSIAQAETEGAALREQQAPIYGEPHPPGTPEELASTPRSRSAPYKPEGSEPGIGYAPDESSMESTQVAPAKGGLNVGRGAPKPYVPSGPEPGIAYQRDESMLYAPTTRPDYSKLANPVYDPILQRTIVSDIGTPTNGGTGLRVTTEDTYKARGVMLRTDVIGAITKAAQQLSSFALRTGLVPPHSSGLYDPQTKEARIAKYGDIIAAAHEAGHAIETTAFGHEWSPDRQANWPKIEQELTRLGKTLYPDSTPHNGHVSEGFAEFEKLWLLQSEDIVRLAPETTNWHDTVFLKAHPEFDSALNAARESGDQYRFQGSAKRTQPVDPTSWAIRFRTSNFGELFRSFRTAWIDTAESLYELNRAAVDAGHLFETGKRAIDVFTAKRGTSDGVLDYFINRGTFDIARQRTGDSLSDVLAKVREANRGPDFRRYLKLRAEQWRNETKTVTDPTTGQRVVAAEEIPTLAVDMPELANLEAKNPAFRGASDGVLSWWDRVMSYVGDHDPVLKRAIEQMRQSGEFYMPLHRWLEGAQPQARGGGTPGGKRALTHGEIGKRSGGSKRETIDPLTSLVRDARAAIEVAHRRAVYNAVKDNALEAGLSSFVTDVTTKMRQDSGSLPFKPGESYGMPAGNLIAQQIFSTGTIQHPDGPIVPTLEARTMPDGTSGFEIRYYQFDPRLHDAVMSMDPNQAVQALGMLGTTLRMSRNLFVLGAVGWNPAFMLLGNPIRDAQALYVNSRNSPHLFSLIPQLVYEHSRVALHQISQGKIPYVWNDAFEKLGLDKTNPYSTYRSAGATARSLTNGGVSRFIDIDSPQALMHVFGHIMGVTERGTRIWELKHTAERVGWTPGEPMSPEQAVAMAVDAKQVTVDFQAGGKYAQEINRILPFFNVLFQGPRAYVRGPKDAYYAAKGNSSGGVGAAKGAAGVAKSAFTLRNLSLMGLGAALWYRYKDEEWMRSMPADERFRYLFFPLPDGPNGEKRLGRMPLNQEAALPIKLFEFALDAMHTKDPYSTSQYVSAFLQNFVPQANPIVAEAIEQATNSRTLSGESQIVPDKQKYLLHKDQISPYDGRFAIVLGGAMHVAPSRITHALENLFGSAGSWVGQRNFFGLLGPATNEQDPDSGSLMGSLTRKNGPISSSSRWVSDLYDLREVTERNYAVKVDADSVMRRLLAQNATQLVSLSHAIMENSPKMSQVDKQRMYSEVNAIAEDAVHQLRGDGKVNPQKAIQTRVQYEARSFQAKREAGIKP
jgi:hypothetical protein